MSNLAVLTFLLLMFMMCATGAHGADFIDVTDQANNVIEAHHGEFELQDLSINRHTYSFFQSCIGYTRIELGGSDAWALWYDLSDQYGNIIHCGSMKLENVKISCILLRPGLYKLMIHPNVMPVLSPRSYDLKCSHSFKAPVIDLITPANGAYVDKNVDIKCYPAALDGNPGIAETLVRYEDSTVASSNKEIDSANIPITELPAGEIAFDICAKGTEGGTEPLPYHLHKISGFGDLNIVTKIIQFDFINPEAESRITINMARRGRFFAAVSGKNAWALKVGLFKENEQIAQSAEDYSCARSIEVDLDMGSYDFVCRRLRETNENACNIAVTMTYPSLSTVPEIDCECLQDLFDPSGDSSAPYDRCSLSVISSNVCVVEAIIKDSDGVIVREFEPVTCGGIEQSMLTWDGRTDQGRIVPEGAYFFEAASASAKTIIPLEVKYHANQS